MSGASENVVLTLFLIGLLVGVTTGGIVTYVLVTRGSSIRRSISTGTALGVAIVVLDAAITAKLPIWMTIIGLAVIPLIGVYWATGWFGLWEWIHKTEKEK